jgi:hypothetical protein
LLPCKKFYPYSFLVVVQRSTPFALDELKFRSVRSAKKHSFAPDQLKLRSGRGAKKEHNALGKNRAAVIQIDIYHFTCIYFLAETYT